MEISEYNKPSFLDGVKACVPTILGYLGIGFAMGVVGKGIGLSVFQIFLMSLIVYAGSAQFIICGMLAIQAPISSIIVTVFFINLRHFLMSLSVAPYFQKETLLENIGIGSLLTDESYGVLTTYTRQNRPISVPWMNGLNLLAYAVWVVSTVLGGIFGRFISSPESLGLDFALVAMFLGLFLFQMEAELKRGVKKTITVLVSVCFSLYVLMIWTTPEFAVIGATLIGATIGVLMNDE
ncbi:AzlC family ABC transporter permease [Enterococcus alcedinis]|uniref:Transporter n=1 Tax=Enterococcus alcedinis TaxID=1274384 RepID=A0A917JGY9_9ENTE|nr:AzlC family ABC transporter permease [Enterococcus alcedinis]MBP2103184.1 4-azaleucine resistance transporter AzlC [Enterococcus alcedinis]GGI66748.1 transporter [Enterococcus alcedinis]